MHRGYIKIWRKLEDSGLLQMHSTFTLFVYMLMQANHKPIKYGMETVDRGQFITGRHKLSEAIGLSEQKLRTCVDKLHILGMITSKPTNKYTLYTIVNYGQYQDTEDVTNQQINQQLTNNQPTTNQQLTTIQEHKNLRIKEKPSARGTRLQTDFTLTPEWGNTALEIRLDWCNTDVDSEFDGFRDYWVAQPGQKGVKADWLATWRNWCRRSNRKGEK